MLKLNGEGASWYKGNLHIHSTLSDGGRTLAELADMYASHGYHFLARTDHWVASRTADDPASYPLLWLDGVELDGRDHGGSYYHVVCLGAFTGITRQMGFVPALEAARAQGGRLILAHPTWTGNSQADVLRWGFHGVEVYNHVCQWLNGRGDGAAYWSMALERFPQTLALAVDDAHIRAEHPGWDGGWVVVNAPERTSAAIMDAIAGGRYYSSCGPAFEVIESDVNRVRVHTSPVRFVRLVGPAWLGKRVGSFSGDLLTQAEFEVPEGWAYAYVEIEDAAGRRAWTNPLPRPAKQA